MKVFNGMEYIGLNIHTFIEKLICTPYDLQGSPKVKRSRPEKNAEKSGFSVHTLHH